jgi:hypothetical protein
MILVNEKTGVEVKIGDAVKDFRDEVWYLVGSAAPPRYSGSTGRIFVNIKPMPHDLPSESRSFYPSVCGLKFVEKPNET